MALTDTKLRQLKPTDKDTKLADAGGLYLLHTKAGAKLWRLKYRLNGREGVFAIGAYPEISLADARIERDRAKALIKQGKNPTTERKLDRLVRAEMASHTFEAVARELIQKLEAQGKTKSAKDGLYHLERHVFPDLGNVPFADIKTSAIKVILDRLEKRGTLVTASRVRSFAGQVFRYGIIQELRPDDPTFPLRRYIQTPQPAHKRVVASPPELYKAILQYRGHPSIVIAAQVLMLVASRTKEVRFMEKTELRLDEGIWVIPAAKMKMRRIHVVPLAPPVVELLRKAIELSLQTSPNSRYVFPILRSSGTGEVISESTINKMLYALGGETSGHGFRTTFSTHMHELQWPTDWIDAQLAHKKKDKSHTAYNHALHLNERRNMMKCWAAWITGATTTLPIPPFAYQE
ncbi:tyrosine-type recombinase/integrase [Chitinimonas koreensis]|uniref:tyrosine-type recombinase/integrase n=1 Tax=Chitinimonas koreensis TaxID=356302 RepID=UPI000A015D50|nr:integrase arm-type DNA-binding domain-containing protein [Chitinimonas koreensis]QNM95438.1 integrase arm-type DNA-binding domain-containing protein [Chitinimonas koreensis]